MNCCRDFLLTPRDSAKPAFLRMHLAKLLPVIFSVLLAMACAPVDESDSIDRKRPWTEVFTLLDSIPLQTLEGDPLGRPVDAVEWGQYLAVADLHANNIKVFDSAGGLAMTLGRSGDGPGEFRGPRALAALPDGRLAAADRATRRLTFFSPDGSFERRVSLPVAGISGMAYDQGRQHVILAGRMLEEGMTVEQLGNALHRFTMKGEHIGSFGLRPQPKASAEASAQNASVGVIDDAIAWGLLSETTVHLEQKGGPSVRIEEVPPTPWETFPEDVSSVMDWRRENQVALVDVIPWRDSFVIHFVGGIRREGTDHHTYAIVSRDGGYRYVEGTGKEILLAEWDESIVGVGIADDGGTFLVRYQGRSLCD